ncbi:hypothetical protein EGW08_018053, partial [Elysia chlorotica]
IQTNLENQEHLKPENSSQKLAHSRNPQARIWKFSKAASEVRQIVFAKVHKAASSTLQNILLRFALARDLNVLIPSHPPVFSDRHSHISGFLPHPGGHGKPFDIHCTHVIYNETEVAKYFTTDAVRIAILREPIQQAISALWYYMKNFPYLGLVKGILKHYRDPVNGLLNNPQDFDDPGNERGPAFSYTNNRMSVDLGFDLTDFEASKRNSSKINAFIQQVEEQFDLVLISDYFDESMVLVRRYLRWSMKDILYIKRNSAQIDPNSTSESKPVLNSTTYNTFRQWNRIDFELYEHFLSIFLQKVKEEQHFDKELNVYKWILKNINNFCLNNSKNQTLRVSQGKWNEAFTVSPTDCQLMLKN